MSELIDPLDTDTTPVDLRAVEGYALLLGALLGQYRVVRMLGKGGMGQVYEVEHTTLGRRYALKLLSEDFNSFSVALERFRREAKVMANIEHPNIIRVDEFGETKGRYWLRMELAAGIEGTSEFLSKGFVPEGDRLLSLADLTHACGGKVSQEILLPILRQMLDGLAYAHAQGAVHRDLKPSNVLLCGMIGAVPLVKITDFGLVKLAGEEWVKTMLVQRDVDDRPTIGLDTASTSSNQLLGTYQYMSPEQKRGEEADERSDLYAIGLIVYHLLTGEELGMRTPSQLDSSLDPAWDALVLKALENRPDKRFQSVGEMIAVLNGLKCDGKPRPAPVSDEEPQKNEDRVAEKDVQPNPPKKGSRVAAVSAKKSSKGRSAKSGGSSSRVKHKRPNILPGLLIVVAVYVGGLLLFRNTVGESYPSPKTPQMGAQMAGQNISIDLGNWQKIKFVWIPSLKGWVGKYEVTNGEYRRFKPSHDSGDSKGDSLDANRQPVVNVSWNDTQEYIRWMKVNCILPKGYELTLPSETEWMTVAQCSDSRKYPWGDSWPPKYGNYDDETKVNPEKIDSYSDGYKVACPVKKSGRNDWDVYGIGGNVWEWTKGPGAVSYVPRGASWADSPSERLSIGYSSERLGALYRRERIGFRLFLRP